MTTTGDTRHRTWWLTNDDFDRNAALACGCHPDNPGEIQVVQAYQDGTYECVCRALVELADAKDHGHAS